ncbi:hypothetical protein GGI22_005026 [Coemansia erecta]|nr:hypothetical protein GGI22_005026 [Coemansia erecta]
MSGKKAVTETRPQSEFFAAPKSVVRKLQLNTGKGVPSENTDDTDSVGIRDVLRSKLAERRKAREEARSRGDDEWDSAQFVQLDRETSDHVKSLIKQSDAIRRVRKDRIFEDEVTEEEQSIIQQRVALQQRQFAEFERREFAHKSRRIRNVYGYLDDEEMREALVEARNDVDEAIYQFSAPGYLMKLRRAIALRHMPLAEAPQMTEVQRVKYEEMLKKRNRVQKKTTTSDARDKYRTVGRLPLDEALAQLQRAATAKSGSGGIDLSRAMKGWSEARIKAFKAIKTKPNTYYYRFNAPGEEQRTGQWTPEEQKLFHARLGEIGANGQWGIFSMVIPGRVGYQCSNYYRYLVENRLIHDPNYVLDENGKAHYLFTTKKKNPDGSAMRVFRKHKKPHVRMSREKYGYSDSDSDDAAESAGASSGLPSETTTVAIGAAAEPADSDVSAAARQTQDASALSSRKVARVAGAATASRRKRKRRGKSDANSSDEDVIRANEVELSDDGARTSDGEYQGSAISKRIRGRGTRSSNLSIDSGNSSAVEPPTRGTDTAAASSGEESTFESDSGGPVAIDPDNPLPELIDPITLEPVSKPAMSPSGHVMDYNSWVRCLMFPPEGSQRNVCPLTKKPLSKRDLVVLTYDNIEQYRDKIVNL